MQSAKPVNSLGESEILDRVRDLYNRNESLKALDIQRQDRHLYIESLKVFGSWAGALEVAGVPVPSGAKRREWTVPEIERALRVLVAREGVLSKENVDQNDVELYMVVRRKFGSLKRAAARWNLPYADLQPTSAKNVPACEKDAAPRPKPKRTTSTTIAKAFVIATILKRKKIGMSLSPDAKDREALNLRPKAIRLFGSWQKALKVASESPHLPPSNPPSPPAWPRQQIIQALRERA